MHQAHELATAAGIALKNHEYSKAEELYRQVIELTDDKADPESPNQLDVAYAFKALAEELERQNKSVEAEEMRRRATRITAKELNEIDGFDR